MNGQEHKVNLGEGGEALLVVDNPIIKFWKKADFSYDLSKCKEEYRALALKELTEIVKEKLRGREISIHFHFGY